MTYVDRNRYMLACSPASQSISQAQSPMPQFIKRQTALGLPYLKAWNKPVQKTQPLSKPQPVKPLSRRLSQLIDGIFGLVGVGAIGLALLLNHAVSEPVPNSIEPDTHPSEEAAAKELFEYVGSPEFRAFQAQYAQEKLAADLAAAERLKDEANGLREEADVIATQTKLNAEQTATAMRLEASYDGVEQRYHRPKGFVISLNYPTTVERIQTEFGYKVIATPTTERGTVRVYINLGSANEGFIPAEGEIGKVGYYPVGEGVKQF